MRRTTLGPISSSQLNTRSTHIPTRASYDEYNVDKTSQTRRVSISTAFSNAPPNKRASISNRNSLNNPPNRRSSTYSAGNRASSLSARNGIRQDPRPITDRAYMNTSIHKLLEFLSARQYDAILSTKLLKGPTKKEFSNILSFLFRQIDGNFAFQAKFEEEIAYFFKVLHYPFPISKTALSAVGTLHTWPALLASITWLIELLSYDEEVERANNVEEFDGENGDKVFLEYLNQAYRAFLSGEDEKYRSLEQNFAQKIESKNEVFRTQCMELAQNKEELLKRIEQAKAEKSSLPALNARKADYMSDLEKFKKLIAQLENLKENVTGKALTAENLISEKKRELENLYHEMESLHVKIDSQEISAEDAQRMKQERHRLHEIVQQTNIRHKELQSENWRIETDLVELMDKLENQVERYQQLAMQLKLVPSMAKNARGINYEIQVDIHTGGIDAAIHLSAHIRKNIRPAISNFRKNRIERFHIALDEASQLEQEVAKSSEVVHSEAQSIQSIELKIRKVDETLRREKESCEAITKQHATTTEEMELRIANILNEVDLSAEELSSQQLLQQTNDRYKNICDSYLMWIEQTRHRFTNALTASNVHKEETEKLIANFAEYVEDFELSLV